MVYKVNSFKHNSTPDYFTLKSVWLEGTNKKKNTFNEHSFTKESCNIVLQRFYKTQKCFSLLRKNILNLIPIMYFMQWMFMIISAFIDFLF